MSKNFCPGGQILKFFSNAIFYSVFGGGERVRTDDLLRARQALSQLSYTPINFIERPHQGPKLQNRWWA